ncbi:expressed conserved protein [Echinococcus multilocularis]|uniref:Expressed conserved protein n=1 Tax=Echinococcus multilocularis TaxID=6211 RepID=A0A068YFL0_ECHMU|nr:expressed conserved protein [Echinococcus multilocularis]
MQYFQFSSIILLVTLLPVAILAYGSTMESIIDSTLVDAPDYLVTHTKKTQVEAVESLVRSCPFSFHEALLNGEVVYTLGVCINATRMTLSPPESFVRKMEIGKLKLNVLIKVKKAVPPEVKLELSAPVFDSAYVYFGTLRIEATAFKSMIVEQTRTRLESELRSFIYALR